MKKIILLTFICGIICVNGYSQTKQELIRELFQVMKQDSLADKMFNSVLPSMMAQMGQNLSPEHKAKADSFMKSKMQPINKIMKQFINDDMAQIYDKRFTQEEIKDYIAFYKTPSGQKMINSLGEIQKDVMTIMMQKYMPMIRQEMMH